MTIRNGLTREMLERRIPFLLRQNPAFGSLSPSQMEVVAANDIKQRARAKLARAVKTGQVRKPNRCSACGAEPENQRLIHGHHADYSKPFDVVWLCRDCHYEADVAGLMR